MRLFLFFALLLGQRHLHAEAPSPAQAELQTILTKQNHLVQKAAREEAELDEDEFRVSVQEICYEYDDYLKKYPEVAAGYASYGLLLAKIDMRKESTAMLLKANRLDSDIPQVKNQLGNFLAEEGKPLEAIGYFVAATKLAPEEPLYHYQLGTLLYEAREAFLAKGEWTRTALDRMMLTAFRRAADLAPQRIEFTYRYAESFYDLETPAWDGALAAWAALGEKESSGPGAQVVLLHRARIYFKKGEPNQAHALLAQVTAPELRIQKEKLVAEQGKPAKE